MNEKYLKNYNKLIEAINKGELYNYLSSDPHYRCTPELGMQTINDFTAITENINYFLDKNPNLTNYFYETILSILNNGSFYDVFSVSNFIRKQYSWQLHKMSRHLLINSQVFIALKNSIIKYYNEFRQCKEFTTSEKGMMEFYENWNNFLKQNSNERVL